jgi:hypothetical protein
MAESEKFLILSSHCGIAELALVEGKRVFILTKGDYAKLDDCTRDLP